jgi:hypothetical protein
MARAANTTKTNKTKKGESAHEKAPGLPRTHGAAKKLKGVKKADHTFDDLSPKLKSNFIKLAESGARAGSFCGAGPSTDPAYWLVCYKNAAGACHWVQVPKGSRIPPNDPE